MRKYTYVYRNPSSYSFRLRLDHKEYFNETFSDSEYGGKRAAKKAALAFSKKKLKLLPLSFKRHLHACMDAKKTGINIRYRMVKGKRTAISYIAKFINRATKISEQKEYSFGRCRTKAKAYQLAKQWRNKKYEKYKI
jgi:hypothetical protein